MVQRSGEKASPRARSRGSFGTVERLPSGRFRAKYTGPDGRRHAAPKTFLTKTEGRDWLALRQSEIIRKAWKPPEGAQAVVVVPTFATFAAQWVANRDLKPRTRDHYGKLLTNHLLPRFGTLRLSDIHAEEVRTWHAEMNDRGTPTLRAHCYGLLRAILHTAVSDRLIDFNPCVVRGAGKARRVHKIRPATPDELVTIAGAMPSGYGLMILLGGWCALRYGECTALVRSDMELSVDAAVIHIDRGVVNVGGEWIVSTPKTQTSIRDVSVPPHLVPVIREHLAEHVGRGRDALLFPAPNIGGHLAGGTFKKWFHKARAAAGRDDLRYHDLRHTGAVLAAATGASLAELMSRLGHSSVDAAMRYQHASQQRDREIAELLSKIATNGGGVA